LRESDVGQDARVHVLFATAELAPVAQVGGLGIAAAGLVDSLRALDVDVTVVLPDYADLPLADEELIALDVPDWAGPAAARTGVLDGVGPITLVRAWGTARPHPYQQPNGWGWPDNDRRFLSFSAAVGALTTRSKPDLLHLNDWHTAAALAFVEVPPPTVLTLHNLAHQGNTNSGWLLGLPYHRDAYFHDADCNPLVGGIRLADLVIAVSPTYAEEIRTPAGGMGVDDELRAKADRLVGIRNGIDESIWNPSMDAKLPRTYDWPHVDRKADAREAVEAELGLEPSPDPLVVVVSRLVVQKGIDLLVPSIPFFDHLPARLAVLGDGDEQLAGALAAAAAARAGRVAFRRGYDDGLAHLLFGAGDLLLMPSRFEPCGLAQMQAMRYGTIPVVTDVGGLHDTVTDADRHHKQGTGIVAPDASAPAVTDALHRGVRLVASHKRRRAAQRHGMRTDWSWLGPAHEHVVHYEELLSDRGAP
jgi:starch synthase